MILEFDLSIYMFVQKVSKPEFCVWSRTSESDTRNELVHFHDVSAKFLMPSSAAQQQLQIVPYDKW